MKKAIYTIVERGNAERVIEAAITAGSHGGTIINARGSGIHDTARLFGIRIEPEKELVLIIAAAENVRAIVKSISETLMLSEPGNGIVFIQDVVRTRGLYEPVNG